VNPTGYGAGDGTPLEFKTEQRHKEDYRGTTEYRLVWDERLGYVLNCTSHFAMPVPKGIEFNNLLAGGIAESRDDHKRWQKTMRGRLPDGRISFVHHNPVNIPVDDVQSGGFVGFVTEEEMNPFVEMLETSVPVFFATCSEWYDQHIVMNSRPSCPMARCTTGRSGNTSTRRKGRRTLENGRLRCTARGPAG